MNGFVFLHSFSVYGHEVWDFAIFPGYLARGGYVAIRATAMEIERVK